MEEVKLLVFLGKLNLNAEKSNENRFWLLRSINFLTEMKKSFSIEQSSSKKLVIATFGRGMKQVVLKQSENLWICQLVAFFGIFRISQLRRNEQNR